MLGRNTPCQLYDVANVTSFKCKLWRLAVTCTVSSSCTKWRCNFWMWPLVNDYTRRTQCTVWEREDATFECDLSWMIARDVRSVRSESCGTSCFWKQKLAVYLVCWDHMTTNVTLSCGASKSMHFLKRCDGLGLTYRSVLANLFCHDVRRCFFFTFWFVTIFPFYIQNFLSIFWIILLSVIMLLFIIIFW